MLLHTIRILPHVVQQSKSTENAGGKKKKIAVLSDAHPCSLQTPPLFVKGCRALQCCMDGGGKTKGER